MECKHTDELKCKTCWHPWSKSINTLPHLLFTINASLPKTQLMPINWIQFCGLWVRWQAKQWVWRVQSSYLYLAGLGCASSSWSGVGISSSGGIIAGVANPVPGDYHPTEFSPNPAPTHLNQSRCSWLLGKQHASLLFRTEGSRRVALQEQCWLPRY